MFTLNAVRTKLTKLKITKTKETARLGLIQSFFKAEEQVFFLFFFLHLAPRLPLLCPMLKCTLGAVV